MKRICIVTTMWTSINNWFRPVFEEYKKLGVDVTVVCNMSAEYEAELNEQYPYIHTKSFPFPRGISIGGSINSIKLLKRFFKEQRFDYIQYHTPNAAFYASIAGKMAKVPLRVYGQWGIRYVTFFGVKRAIFKMLEKITCAASTHVRAQSPKNRLFNISEGMCKPDKITVIGIGGTIGVDFNEFDISRYEAYREEIRSRYNLKADEFVFGFIGRIHRDKGVNELIEAFKEIENAKLLLVGDLDENYPPRQENLQFIEANDSVMVTGRVLHDEVPKYLCAMDILVHPTYREGFGHIMQEAMTMGVPVITTDVPGPSEVVEDDISGKLVPAQNSRALSEEMHTLMNDEDRRKRYASNGRTRAERYFEQSVMVGHIIDDYKRMLNL
ncbi:MAG: glycosyltransferase family 4 protein [Clostridia bacterium]|nr:glycosyltransferase family 4 protein [Clostridia bacterium]